MRIFGHKYSYIGYMTSQEYIYIAKQQQRSLYRFAVRYTGDNDKAWDAVQDCLVTLWTHCEEVATTQAKGYLIRVMYRQLVDKHRRELRMETPMPEHLDSPAYMQHERWELHDQLQHALGQLTEQHRAILLMKDLEGYQYTEIAQMTGLNEMQVAGILYRARVQLKKLITSYNEQL